MEKIEHFTDWIYLIFNDRRWAQYIGQEDRVWVLTENVLIVQTLDRKYLWFRFCGEISSLANQLTKPLEFIKCDLSTSAQESLMKLLTRNPVASPDTAQMIITHNYLVFRYMMWSTVMAACSIRAWRWSHTADDALFTADLVSEICRNNILPKAVSFPYLSHQIIMKTVMALLGFPVNEVLLIIVGLHLSIQNLESEVIIILLLYCQEHV